MERLPETMQAPRLTLRRWVPDDAEPLGAAITENIDHLRPWMPWIAAEPQSVADRVALIDQWHNEWDRGGDMVIGAFLDGAVVGSAGLHRRRGPRVLEIGYWVHGDHIRKGFATEIASALTTAAFTVADIDRVEIHHDKANIASSGVPRRTRLHVCRRVTECSAGTRRDRYRLPLDHGAAAVDGPSYGSNLRMSSLR